MELKIIPRMSEKSYAQAQNEIYIFDVPIKATKQQIGDAVAKQYDVAVQTVNVVVAKGKVKRSYRKGGTPIMGKRKNVKKAYVRLAEGNSIPVFAGVEETEEKK